MKSLKDIKFNASAFIEVDIETVLQRKNIEYSVHNSSSGKWLRMNCLFPDHTDTNPSFFIHAEHGGFNCYRCGSGNWKELCERLGWEFDQTETIKVDEYIPEAIWKDCLRNISKIRMGDKKEPELKFHIPKGYKLISKDDVRCRKHLQYLKGRGIENLVEQFEIGYTIINDGSYGQNYMNRLIIPCHNKEGEYIWPEGRSIIDDVKNKYYRPDGIKKVKYLFNLNRVVEGKFKYVVVVEGIIDAMVLWSWGVPGVCCFGADISDFQVEILISLFDKIYICLDNDVAGIKGYLGAKEKMVGAGLTLKRIILPKNKDINSINNVKIFNRLFKTAKNIQ